MAYSAFTLAEALRKFNLAVDTTQDMFAAVPPVALFPAILNYLERNLPLASLLSTEKGKAELLVAPLIAEVWNQSGRRVSVYSGIEFDVDEADGLTGACDHLLSRGPQLPFVTPPILVVVEAKRDDFTAGFGQCVAEMVAALRVNTRENTGVEVVYGAVTNAATWKFLRLKGTDLSIDVGEYPIRQPDKILGVLLHMVGFNPPPTQP
jgi:hypothetical protein